MRWFTSADATVPPEQYESYIEQNQGWNFGVNILDLTFFNLAMSFIFGTTVLSLYTSYLTTSAVLIGLIPALQNVSFFWPQLIMARHAQRLPRKKTLLAKVSVMERIPYLFVALVALQWADAPRPFAYGVLAFSLLVASSCGGLGSPAWKGMLGKVIPVTRRGRLFGLSSALGGLLGVGGAALSRQVLSRYPYPTSFGICFLLCFASQVISYTCVMLNREPPRESPTAMQTTSDYWRRLPTIMRENPNLARYLVARALTILGGMAATFYVIYGRKYYGISDEFAATLTIVALASQTVSTPLMGILADRRGNKLLAEMGGIFAALGVLALCGLHGDQPGQCGLFDLGDEHADGIRRARGDAHHHGSGQHDLGPADLARPHHRRLAGRRRGLSDALCRRPALFAQRAADDALGRTRSATREKTSPICACLSTSAGAMARRGPTRRCQRAQPEEVR
jgi:MFS family permease